MVISLEHLCLCFPFGIHGCGADDCVTRTIAPIGDEMKSIACLASRMRQNRVVWRSALSLSVVKILNLIVSPLNWIETRWELSENRPYDNATRSFRLMSVLWAWTRLTYELEIHFGKLVCGVMFPRLSRNWRPSLLPQDLNRLIANWLQSCVITVLIPFLVHCMNFNYCDYASICRRQCSAK
jgi:hypothetical protein